MPEAEPLACVLGDINLLRPLGLAGISSAVGAPPLEPIRWSRFARAHFGWADPWSEPNALVEHLVRFGQQQKQRPVLFYEGDGELLVVSRHRERLAPLFAFLLPDAKLIEDLANKARFQSLAEQSGLPVPRAALLAPGRDDPEAACELEFPLVIKPLHRRSDSWSPLAGEAKAIRVDTPAQLRGLWDRLAAAGLEVVAQELVPGPETSVESYHVYVDRSGAIVAEFTGQKLRTRPTSFGQSTTVQITQRADVATLGREVTRRLELLGVAKIDFKRDLQGKLHLLEVNPRFNLWHYPGALAGVNLPALAYADLAGRPRPHIRPVRPGVRWCSPREDLPAARAAGVSLPDWILHSLVPSEARGMLAWDDPLPFLIAAARLLRSELGSRVGRANMARASGGRGGH